MTAVHRLVTNEDVSWFDVEASIRQIPTLSPRFVRHFDGSIPDIAPDGERAVPVPPRNSEALIIAVTDLIERPSKQDRFKCAGYEFVTAYSWDDCTQEFEKTLRVIASPNAS